MGSFVRALLLMSVALPAQADTAFVVGTVDGIATNSYGAPRYVGTALQPLDHAGFEVISAIDADTETLRGLVGELVAMQEEDRMVIILAGRFVHFEGLTWFLGREAGVQGLGSVSGAGIPVQLLLDIAAASEGRALVLLGPEDQGLPMGPGLNEGLGNLEVPEGVTLAIGHPAAVARFATRELLVQGRPLRAAFERAPGLSVQAINAPDQPFMPAPVVTPTVPPADQSYWEAMVALNNVFAYQAYLNRYPNGYYAAEAQARIAALQPPQPQLTPEEVEAALGLNRTQRRQIQRDLAILNYYSAGIDGIFGQGTRGGIRAWQRDNNLQSTGYLDAAQVQRLADQGEVRRAELQAQDRAFWQQTGSGNDEAGLRAYLNRYPNGEFAEIARERIAAIEEARAEQADIDYWNQTGRGTNEAGLRAYLQRYPQGQFAGLARQRLEDIDAQQDRDYWSQTGANGTEAGLRAYLQRYPQGIFNQTARQQLNALVTAGNHGQAWQQARAEDTLDAYRAFINTYPDSPHVQRARARINEIQADNQAWQAAVNAGTAQAYRDYLNIYPDGRHADDARQRLQTGNADEQAWRTARDQDTVAAYRQYLDDFSEGAHAAEAQARIDALTGGPSDPAIGQMSQAQLQLAATGLRRVGLLPNGNVSEADIVASLRRYQRSRGLEETGMLDRQTMALLTVEALGGNN
ncbi:peptidoglycan-binding protein [Alterinioella nitratireducens]|uniref:peptidoglycan-binding protein n=1 Tax=Alterinioella nitratireducens TaxID=2735915 RepID=UPI001551640A|nr:peptidoglycan-binding protein [Alterinioella nitratireducens]NPD18824.1 hypothetical protein [Alterinioella nitratireducens]